MGTKLENRRHGGTAGARAAGFPQTDRRCPIDANFSKLATQHSRSDDSPWRRRVAMAHLRPSSLTKAHYGIAIMSSASAARLYNFVKFLKIWPKIWVVKWATTASQPVSIFAVQFAFQKSFLTSQKQRRLADGIVLRSIGAAIGVGSSNRTPQSFSVTSRPRSFRIERDEIDSTAVSNSITKSSFSRNALISSLFSYLGPSLLTSPFSSTEPHLLPPASSLPFVVFQNEPSSIIAYTLWLQWTMNISWPSCKPI